MKKSTKDLLKKINLQRFAENNTGVRVYAKEFKELINPVFAEQSYFLDMFGGKMEARDGVQNNKNAFSVKTNDMKTVIADYNTDANVGMGTGTGKSSRFGERKEVVYKDVDVPYKWGWSFHEGLDRATINNDMDAAVIDRLDLQAEALIAKANAEQSKYISASAKGRIEGGATVTKDNVAEVFAKLSAYFVNAKVKKGTKLVAKVNTAVYDAIVNSNLSTTSKHSDTNIDTNEVRKFKGFEITELPDDAFQINEVVYAYAVNIGKAFTGIVTTRTIDSEDFDGVALQGQGKAGEYVPEVNMKAIAKVTVTGA